MHVLDSEVSEQMRRWFRIPDAALGAIAYLGDLIFGLAGSTRRWQYRPWLVVLVALWLIGVGFWASSAPAPPALQNDILVGLLLLMFAIIPNQANLPPPAWRKLLGDAKRTAVKR